MPCPIFTKTGYVVLGYNFEFPLFPVLREPSQQWFQRALKHHSEKLPNTSKERPFGIPKVLGISA